MKKGGTKIKFSSDQVRNISEQVYRRQLDSDCGAGTAAMTDEDIAAGRPGPDGKQKIPIRARAKAYDRLTRFYLEVLGIEP